MSVPIYKVDFPMTVYVGVLPAGYNGQSSSDTISRAVLQYRVLPSGDWVTVKDYLMNAAPMYGPDTGVTTNINWNIQFKSTVALFGRNNIHPKNSDGSAISVGTYIMIRVYFEYYNTYMGNGTYDTNISNSHLQDTIFGFHYDYNNADNNWSDPEYEYGVDGVAIIDGGWAPSYVVTVRYSGKSKIVR